MKRETAETDRENRPSRSGGDAAAVSENAPQDGFGLNLANRRCSERRTVSRLLHQWPEQAEGKWRFTRCIRKVWNGRAELQSRNRQVVGRRSSDRTNCLTGPDAGKRCRAMKAGSSENGNRPKSSGAIAGELSLSTEELIK